jgi:hypothetical protein
MFSRVTSLKIKLSRSLARKKGKRRKEARNRPRENMMKISRDSMS